MAFNSKYLQFAKNTGTGVQTVTGVGFTGKALLLWSTFQTAAGATTAAMMCLGMTDGVLQSVRFIHHPGAEAATTSAQAEQTDHIVFKVGATSGATPTVQVAGVFGAFNSDGFTINWTTNDGNADILHAIVLGGDIEAAFRQVKITGNSGTSIDVTDVDFRPSSYVVMGGAADEFGTGDYNLGAPFGSLHGFGFSNAVDNICSWTLGLGTGGAADCYKGQMTDAVASVRAANTAGAGSLMDARITASLNNGFTITRDVGTSANQPVQHVLCLKGVRFALGSFTAPLTAINKVVTLPFEPDVFVVQSIGAAASENMAGMGLSLGAWHRADDASGGVWIGGVDAANPSEYRRSTYEDLLIETRNPSGGAAVMQASVVSSSATDVTLDFDAVSGSSDAIIYMAMAATEPIVGVAVFGVKTTVTATRAIAFGLDNNTNVHNEAGKHKVFGKIEATETIQVGDVTAVGATKLIGWDPTSKQLQAVDIGTGADLTDNELTASGGSSAYYMSPLTTGGDPTTAELVFGPDGDVVMVPVYF